MRPWVLSEINYGTVKQSHYDVAVLPMAATEPHNLHLPYGTDMYEGTVVGERICEAAYNRGAKVLLLPTMPYGTETNQMGFRLAMNVMPSTLGLVIRDLATSLAHHGIHKLLILNSHGGNDFKPLLRELHGATGCQLFLCNWYMVFRDIFHEIFEHPDDHAGEMETSFILASHPHLVARKADGTLDADAGSMKSTRFEAVNKGWVNITRPWHLLTTNSGAGYPHAASAEKGEKMLAVVTQRLSQFLVELSAAPLDDKFPF
jgi:creatinine amidohydrolase